MYGLGEVERDQVRLCMTCPGWSGCGYPVAAEARQVSRMMKIVRGSLTAWVVARLRASKVARDE